MGSSPAEAAPVWSPKIRDQLRERVRLRGQRCPRSITDVIDFQSVKAAETVARTDRGYDAGKKINGRKRRVAVDTRGLPILLLVTPASLPDEAVARDVLTRVRLANPRLTQVWADSAHGGALIGWAGQRLHLTTDVIPRPRNQHRFVALPRALAKFALRGRATAVLLCRIMRGQGRRSRRCRVRR